MVKITRLAVPDVLLFEPKVFVDQRGFFFESFNQQQFLAAVGGFGNQAQKISFVQDNHSHSVKNVVRGLHYQIQQPQGKLVRVIQGALFDVAVDIRRSSSTFGKWVGEVLSESNKKQLWLPEGFAHGFLVLSETAEFVYKTTDYYAPVYERCILWNDPNIGIAWPNLHLSDTFLISQKDQGGKLLSEAELS